VLLDKRDHMAVNTREFVDPRGHLRLFTEKWSRTGGLQLSDVSYRRIEEYHCMFPPKRVSKKESLKRDILAVHDEFMLLHILLNLGKYLVFQVFDQ
jgi:hypothetical protein